MRPPMASTTYGLIVAGIRPSLASDSAKVACCEAIAMSQHATRPTPPPNAVQVGVLHYRQPDRLRGSKNIGDYVQTLSFLGNLARFSDVEFSGVDGLGELVSDLQTRVRPEPTPAKRSGH